MSSCHTIEVCRDAGDRAIRRPLTTPSHAAHTAAREPRTVLADGGVNEGLRGAGCILGRGMRERGREGGRERGREERENEKKKGERMGEENKEVTSHYCGDHSVPSHHCGFSTAANIVLLTPRAVGFTHTVIT